MWTELLCITSRWSPFYVFFCQVACSILVPWTEVEPTSPTLEAGVFTTGPPGKFRWDPFIYFFIFLKRWDPFKSKGAGDFPSGSVVKTPSLGSFSSQGTKISHAAWHGQKRKKASVHFCIPSPFKTTFSHLPALMPAYSRHSGSLPTCVGHIVWVINKP